MTAELQLPPGFRFHPTDEELVMHYLCRKCASQSIAVPIIAEIDLYKYDPWQLPGKYHCFFRFLIYFFSNSESSKVGLTWIRRFDRQRRRCTGRKSGISFLRETVNIRTVRGRTEQRGQGTGRRPERISPSGIQSRWGLRRLWCFTPERPPRERKRIGLCMNTGWRTWTGRLAKRIIA